MLYLLHIAGLVFTTIRTKGNMTIYPASAEVRSKQLYMQQTHRMKNYFSAFSSLRYKNCVRDILVMP